MILQCLVYFHFRHYGFITYCNKCGNSQAFSWDKLGKMFCFCNNGEVSYSLVVSGPLWTGPLHDTSYLTEMLNLAEEWRWSGTGCDPRMDLEKLLGTMIEESDPELSFGYIKLDEVAKRAKINSPPLRLMMLALKKGPDLFEPIHGSAPDIARQDKANPLVIELSVVLLLYGLHLENATKLI